MLGIATRHLRLGLAIFIFVFPAAFYGFFRLFGENNYVLPVYLDSFSVNDSCQYEQPFALKNIPPADVYLITSPNPPALHNILNHNQATLQKKYQQSITIERLVYQPCLVPLSALFPKQIPSHWVLMLDAQGQVRSAVSLMGKKNIFQAQHDLYLLSLGVLKL